METLKTMLSQNEWEKLNEMIAMIHSIKNLNAMRTALLQKLMLLIDFSYADFNLGLIKKGSKPCLVEPLVVSKFDKSFEDSFQHQYESIYAPMDYVNWVFLSPESLIYRESDLIKEEVRKQSPFYLNYLKVFDLVNIAGMVLASGGNFLGAVTLYKGEKKGDFSERDLYILKQLLPHLQLRLDESAQNDKSEEKSGSYILRHQYLLSNREIEVIGLVYSGASNKNIAESLGLKENTVKKHISNIFEKVQVKSRTQLCRFIMDNDMENIWE